MTITRLKFILVTIALMGSLKWTLLAQKTEPPRFENYSADVYAGKPAPLNLRSHRLARRFRTRIREQLQGEGINFAGHYTIAVMGCGTGCSTTAIVDARNGRAYFPQVLDGWSVEPGAYQFAEDEDVRTFRTDSRLLKIIGSPRLSNYEKWGPSGIYYYEWKSNRLRQVHFVPTGRLMNPGVPPGKSSPELHASTFVRIIFPTTEFRSCISSNSISAVSRTLLT